MRTPAKDMGKPHLNEETGLSQEEEERLSAKGVALRLRAVQTIADALMGWCPYPFEFVPLGHSSPLHEPSISRSSLDVNSNGFNGTLDPLAEQGEGSPHRFDEESSSSVCLDARQADRAILDIGDTVVFIESLPVNAWAQVRTGTAGSFPRQRTVAIVLERPGDIRFSVRHLSRGTQPLHIAVLRHQ